MHDTLLYIPTELWGMPLFGVGLLLAVWGVVCVGVMAWLVWRQGLSADTLTYLGLFALVAAAIVWVLPAVAKPRGLPIRSYGVMMLLAVSAATGLAAWRARRRGQDPDMIFTLLFWILIPGLIGARAFYVIEYWDEQFWPAYVGTEHAPGGLGALLGAVVNIAEGGLVVYGSLIGATLGMAIFARRYRVPLLPLGDLLAPSLMLGLAIGRIGCLLHGCCYGGLCEHPWGVTFPRGEPAAAGQSDDPLAVTSFSPPYRSQVERGLMYGFAIPGDPDQPPVLLSVRPDSPAAAAGLQPGDLLTAVDGEPVPTAAVAHWKLQEVFEDRRPLRLELAGRGPVELAAVPVLKRSLPVHPTQIYSTINALLLCLLLLAYDPFRRRDGELFALMISIYPVSRFLIEILRTDESPIFGTGLSISQNVSLVILLVAAGLWFYVLRRPRGKVWG